MMKYLSLFIMTILFSELLPAQDWPNLSRFHDENAALDTPKQGEKRVVFIGNSITEQWLKADTAFFRENDLINRGIGGQTTPQILLRFRQDVIDLKPVAVVILAGINDIAGNTGPSTLKMITDNFQSMAELANAAGIKVILCTLLPSNRIPWRNNMNPAVIVSELNIWIRHYGKLHGIDLADYYSLLVDENNGLPEKYSGDGVHVNLDAYRIMEEVVLPLISKARK